MQDLIFFIHLQIDFYCKTKAKVSLSVLDRLKDKPNGKYVVVAGLVLFFIFCPLFEMKALTIRKMA